MKIFLYLLFFSRILSEDLLPIDVRDLSLFNFLNVPLGEHTMDSNPTIKEMLKTNIFKSECAENECNFEFGSDGSTEDEEVFNVYEVDLNGEPPITNMSE